MYTLEKSKNDDLEILKTTSYDDVSADVTVVILTYNSDFEKVKYSLKSVFNQEGLNISVIIADDGSKEFDYKEYVRFFSDSGFENYLIVVNKENKGTVINSFNAIKRANGTYVKLLGTGDAFLHNDSLKIWVDNLQNSGKRWSFCESVFFDANSEDRRIINVPAHPQKIKCYELEKKRECMWRYIALDDLPVGANILCQKDIYLEYLGDAIGKVIYAEDFLCRLMMYDEVFPYFEKKSIIFYEFGAGVSTQRTKIWNERLIGDRKAVDEIILGRECNGLLKKILFAVLKSKYWNNSVLRIVAKLIVPGRVGQAIKFRINPRMTPSE